MRKLTFRSWDKAALKMSNPFTLFNNSDFLLSSPNEIEVMQSTGLFDKNGKEIFEFDIVKCAIGVGKVIFHSGSFMLEWIDDKEANMELLGEKNIARGVFRIRDDNEVIGNIFEDRDPL